VVQRSCSKFNDRSDSSNAAGSSKTGGNVILATATVTAQGYRGTLKYSPEAHETVPVDSVRSACVSGNLSSLGARAVVNSHRRALSELPKSEAFTDSYRI
jgi:hypothetical protein